MEKNTRSKQTLTLILLSASPSTSGTANRYKAISITVKKILDSKHLALRKMGDMTWHKRGRDLKEGKPFQAMSRAMVSAIQ